MRRVPGFSGPAGGNPPVPRRGHHRDIYGALDLGTNNCRLADRAPERGRVYRSRRLFAHCPAWSTAWRPAGMLSQESMDRAVEALAICADKLRRRHVTLARSVATEACRRAVNGREFVARVKRRDRNRAGDHLPAGRGAAGRSRLPQVARARRRTGANLRYRRRIDRIGAGRAWRDCPRITRLVVGAVGRGFADRERGPGSDRGQGPGAAYGRMRERVRRSFAHFVEMLPDKPRTSGCWEPAGR